MRPDTTGPETALDELVALASGGSVRAAAELYDYHYEAVRRYVGCRVREAALAEDLTADVFARMLKALPHYRVTGVPFRAWLFRIAHNLVADYFRKASHQPELSLDDPDSPWERGADDPAALVEQKLTLERAYAALNDLDAAQRDVLTLRFLCGLSRHEVALALGKTDDATRSLQRRGLAAVRLALAADDL